MSRFAATHSVLTEEDRAVLAGMTGLTSDSRAVTKGFLFGAFPGSTADGRSFIAAAIEAGARYILAPKGTRLPDDVSGDALGEVRLIEDDNPRLRFSVLASHFYSRRPSTICAVTGTNGKTSSANFAGQIWTLLDRPAASMGTLGIVTAKRHTAGSHTTLPSDVLYKELQILADEGIDHLAMEASSHGLHQYRLHGLDIAAAAFTNLTRDHLDYHPDMEDYFNAKAMLFHELLRADGCAVINADDAYGVRLAESLRNEAVRVWTFGRNGSELRLIEQEPLATGQKLTIEILGERFDVVLPLAGVFQAMNVLCAIGLVMGSTPSLTAAQVVAVLPSLTSVPGRMQTIAGHPKLAGIIVDYAHTPDALETVLKALRNHVDTALGGRLVCLFGCGGNRDKGKRPIMGEIATRLADRVIVTDDNPRHEDATQIRAEILAASKGAQEIADRRAAIRAAVSSLEDGDVLVIAGKGHEQGQTIAGVTFPFDDTEEARQAIAALQERSVI